MSLKETIAKIRAAVDSQQDSFPVKVLGLDIGVARDWSYLEDEGEYYPLYSGFVPYGGSIPAGNILIDCEEGKAYFFKDTTDGVDVEWAFPFDIIDHIIAM